MAEIFFQNLFSKINASFKSQLKFDVVGASPDQWNFIWSHHYPAEFLSLHTHVVVCPSLDEAEKFFDALPEKHRAIIYPGLDQEIYDPVVSSESHLLKRLETCFRLIQSKALGSIIVTTLDALLLKVAYEAFFKNQRLTLKKEDLISPQELAQKLVGLGYAPAYTVEEPGTFTLKGGIVDLYPVGFPPIRIQYFDDFIENIFEIDLETQKSLKAKEHLAIEIFAAPSWVLRDECLSELRKKIPTIQPQHKNKSSEKNLILENLQKKQLFEGHAIYFPLFFEKPLCLFQLLQNPLFYFLGGERIDDDFQFFHEQSEASFSHHQQDIHSSSILPKVESFIFSQPRPSIKPRINISPHSNLTLEQVDISTSIDLSLKPLTMAYNLAQHPTLPAKNEALLSELKKQIGRGYRLIVTYQKENSKSELVFLLTEKEIFPHLYLNASLASGFIYEAEKLIVLSDSDLFHFKSKKVQKNKKSNPDLFAEQIASLKIGDFVVHAEYGVGKYLGLETVRVGDQETDFLVIFYEGNDKVYVPVYRLNLVQKFADQTAEIKVASLKSKKFQEAKSRARTAVKKLAFDLIEIQAKRKLAGGYAFNPPDHLFKEFELAFEFEETPDQLKAIDDVLEDMMSQQAMDRLVCGDVGFGKTEVAMRAAFKAVEDKKQVVVLVPTTVLALQHFNSFSKRFKNFPINIQSLSRFKSPKESKQIFNDVREGKIDILIGTHRLLSEELKFLDLGLVIIDEEHRFGVAHKEKLKNLKHQVDVLTLTATPIPRTLQLAFLGLRDLSLIQTPPPRRQAIKTYLIKQDDETIRNAIQKEISRGGQIFYVHNRVQNIEDVALYLKDLCPGIRLTITHGQMNEKDLELRLTEFYHHQSDLLLTTTIIESGIDIPNANTLIVARADTFGLAQLHQLRGRIGRSDRKAYAYFVVPATRELTELATKRLHSIQTYADMGSGFALASSDLEIRGAGDILGAEQSGHIESIGLELYMQLLEEAILEIKGQRKNLSRQIEIQAPFNAFIPNKYIVDHPTRLKYYKKLSNAQTLDQLAELKTELFDIFGVAPTELETLFLILNSRVYLQSLGVKTVKVAGSLIHLYFDSELLSTDIHLREKILSHFMNKPKLYKFNPDHSVQCFFKENVTAAQLLDFAKYIAAQTGPC